MKVTYPICTNEGDEYLVLISSFNRDVFPDEIVNKLEHLDIVDIVLKRISGDNPTNPKILFNISNLIAGFLNDNENTILYFYCDDINDIPRRDKEITPQKFRSSLFSKMLERYVRANNIQDITNTLLEIKADRDVYIHLISKNIHLAYVDIVKDAILDLASKSESD